VKLQVPAKRGMLNRRHTTSALVLGAVIFAPLAIVGGAPAAPAATGTPTTSLNLSDNSGLSQSAAGYAIQEGGTNLAHHDVRAPVATTTPPLPQPTSRMAPPAGATLVRNLSRASHWAPENGGYLNELAEKGPGGEPVLRSTLVDGQTGAGSTVPNERNDLQGGTVPLGSVRWMIWHERFVKLPTTDLDRWQVIGPNEIHGRTLDQATVMPEVSADKRRRLNANAGRSTTRYFDLGPIVLGEWHQYKFGIYYTQGSNGWIELWKDGVRVMRVEGPTTTEPYSGYWKFGHYRNAAIDGTSIYDVSGTRIYGQ